MCRSCLGFYDRGAALSCHLHLNVPLYFYHHTKARCGQIHTQFPSQFCHFFSPCFHFPSWTSFCSPSLIHRNHLKKGVVICRKESESEKKRQGVYPSVGNPARESSRVICGVTVGPSPRFLEKCQVYGFIMVAIENRLTRPRCCSSP